MNQEFEKAAKAIQSIQKRPSNAELLSLYKYYKQATEGDVKGSRPGMLDMKGRAKYDSWASVKGMAKTEAMEKYVAEVNRILKNA